MMVGRLVVVCFVVVAILGLVTGVEARLSLKTLHRARARNQARTLDLLTAKDTGLQNNQRRLDLTSSQTATNTSSHEQMAAKTPSQAAVGAVTSMSQFETMESVGITDIRRSCEGWGVKEALITALEKMEAAQTWANTASFEPNSRASKYTEFFFANTFPPKDINATFAKLRAKVLTDNFVNNPSHKRMKISCHDESTLHKTDSVYKSCHETEKEGRAYAYVNPSTDPKSLDETEIHLCSAFKTMKPEPLPGTFATSCPPGGKCDTLLTKWGILVHELTHFTTTLGTKDLKYGLVPCRIMSKSSSQKWSLRKNADQYVVFLEAAGDDMMK